MSRARTALRPNALIISQHTSLPLAVLTARRRPGDQLVAHLATHFPSFSRSHPPVDPTDPDTEGLATHFPSFSRSHRVASLLFSHHASSQHTSLPLAVLTSLGSTRRPAGLPSQHTSLPLAVLTSAGTWNDPGAGSCSQHTSLPLAVLTSPQRSNTSHST